MQPFLQALPVVATSSYAFLAYLALIAAWLVLGLRVKRNKNLLDALDKLPREKRLEALQAEMGFVAPPNGISPEQWLKLQSRRYIFLAFALLCGCLTLIGLVAYVISPEDPSKMVGANVTLYQSEESQPVSQASKRLISPYSEALGATDYTVVYESNIGKDGVATIAPRLPYLDALRSGDELGGRIWWRSPFFWTFPALSVEVSNNSKSVIYISEMRLRVVTSNADWSAIPVFHEDMYGNASIVVANEGWGDMTDVSLEISGWGLPTDNSLLVDQWSPEREGFSDPCFHSTYTRQNSYTPDTYVIPQDVPSRERLGDFGFNVSKNIPTSMQDKEFLCARGVLSYTEVGPPAVRRQRPFRTAIRTIPGGHGELIQPSAAYSVLLRAEKAGYTVSVPISQKISPGDVDHFLVKVASDMTATYSLEYQLVDASGIQFKPKKLNIGIFVPRHMYLSDATSEQSLDLPSFRGRGPYDFVERVTILNYDVVVYVRKDMKENECKALGDQVARELPKEQFSNYVQISVMSPKRLNCELTINVDEIRIAEAHRRQMKA